MKPVHLPFSVSEVSVVPEVNLQATFIGRELIRILTVPFPLQLPLMDFRNSASPAWEQAAYESTATERNSREMAFVVTERPLVANSVSNLSLRFGVG
jgi:hypothetical protein